MNGKSELLGQLAASQQLDRERRLEQLCTAQCCSVVGTCRELFEHVYIEHLVLNAGGVCKTAELGLAADKRSLTTFEARASAFANAGLLTLGTATGSGSFSRTVSTGDALERALGTVIGLNGVQHTT